MLSRLPLLGRGLLAAVVAVYGLAASVVSVVSVALEIRRLSLLFGGAVIVMFILLHICLLPFGNG